MPAVGKYGRLPFDPERPRLVLERYLDPRTPLARSGLPPVAWSADVDRSSHVPQIPMYLNGRIGDCTIAALAHLFGAVSVYSGHPEILFADSQVETVYSRVGGYDPGQTQPDGSNPTDNGCLMSAVLADNKANGITDVAGVTHRCLGYASLGNPADEELVAQCLDVFGSVYVGFNVQQHMETQFSDGHYWTWEPGDAEVGGHCVTLQRRYPAGSMVGILEYWTWGARQRANFPWQAHAVEEAWVVVTSEWLQASGTTVDGLDIQQLLADSQLA